MTLVAATNVVTNPPSFPPAGFDSGVVPVHFRYAPPITDFDHADDEVVVFGPMPEKAFFLNRAGELLLSFSGAISTADMDWTFGWGTIAGAITHQLYTGDDIGEAIGTIPSAAVASQEGWLDISGLYFVIVVDTAATTPLAGETIDVAFNYTQNVNINVGASPGV